MRILVIPQYGLGIHGYAPFEVSKNFIRACSSPELSERNVWFTLLMPKPDHQWKYDTAEFEKMFEGTRCKIEYVQMWTSGVDGCAITTAEMHGLFNAIKGTSPFQDVIISHAPMLTPMLHKVLKSKFPRFMPSYTCLSVPPFIRTNERKRMAEFNYSGEEEVIGDLLGCVSDLTMVYNQGEKALLLKEARRYLSAVSIKRLMDTLHVDFFGGVDLRKTDAIWERRKKKRVERPTLFWGGRMVAQKRWDDWLTMTDQINAIRPNTRFLVSTQESLGSTELAALKAAHPHLEIHTEVNKDRFIEFMLEADVFADLSRMGGTSFLEMMAAGLIGVFGKSLYTEDYVAPGAEVPVVVERDDEFVRATVAALSNVETLREKMEGPRNWVREKYDHLGVAERTLDFIEPHVKARRADILKGAPVGSLGQLAANAAKMFDKPFTFSECMAKCIETSESDREWGKRGDLISRPYLRQLILENGFVDLCDGPEPRFANAS